MTPLSFVFGLTVIFGLALIYAALHRLTEEVRALRRDLQARAGTGGDADRPV